MPDQSSTDAAASGVLLRHDDGAVATLTLNRPESFNALSEELLASLDRELRALKHDRHIRAVVLAANGKAFCTGHDLREMRANPGKQAIEALFRQCSEVMLRIGRLPQPVIARVHGVATAAGCQLVATCDLAIASEAARFAVSGINLGLFCGTPGVAISRNMPRKQAFEMLVTGAFIDAAAAERAGLVNRVVPAEALDAEVRVLAETIANKSPGAVALGKKLFYRQLERAVDDAYETACATMVENMALADAQEGIDSFLAKKPQPKWRDR